MSSDPYRERLLAHAKAPQQRGPLDPCDAEATCHNPLCGDRVTLRLRFAGKHIAQARFEARGCAIAIAAASILSERVVGQDRAAAQALAARVIEAVTNGGDRGGFDDDLLALAELFDVRTRRRCATLAWEALLAADAGSVGSR